MSDALEAAVHLAARVVPPTRDDTTRGVADKGALVMAVRNDGAAVALATANGKYSPFSVDAYGRQFVSVATLPLPAGAATEDTLAAAVASLSALDATRGLQVLILAELQKLNLSIASLTGVVIPDDAVPGPPT